jgi:crotonobetainyl-CoA:carnitine CoA-transferase CaiB-like acyl-CoA transferase
MTLNLRSPQAKEIIKKLTKISDVLVENFVPGTAESLGIDYES